MRPASPQDTEDAEAVEGPEPLGMDEPAEEAGKTEVSLETGEPEGPEGQERPLEPREIK